MLHDDSIQVEIDGRKVNHNRRRRHQIRNGHRMAALRAFTAATLYRENKGWNLTMAAAGCGSNIPYVRALLTILRSESTELLQGVLTGQVPVLRAAHEVARLAQLVSAFRETTAAEHAAFGRIVGSGTVFDAAVVPAL